jgi:hypothetical protein
MRNTFATTMLALAFSASAGAEELADASGAFPGELALETLTADRAPTAASWEISVGGDYSSGNYGAATATDVYYFPFGVSYRRGAWTLSLDSGVVAVKGPVNYSDIVDLTLAATAAPVSVNGIGDIVVGAKVAAFEGFESGTYVDVGARVKLPTASRAKGLGNGKIAADIQIDLTHTAGPWSLLGSASYGFRDHTNGNRDTQMLSAGVGRPVTERLAVGAIYEWRTSSRTGGVAAQQGTIYASYDLTSAVSVTAYAGHGFSQASPDTELGLRFSYRWW